MRKDLEESYQRISEMWMKTEYDERVFYHQKIIYGNYIVKMKDDEGLQDEVKKVNTMQLHMGAFVLGNSRRIMKKFIHTVIGFFTNDVYYTDTDSLYIENKQWGKLDEGGLSVRIDCKVKTTIKQEEFGMVYF